MAVPQAPVTPQRSRPTMGGAYVLAALLAAAAAGLGWLALRGYRMTGNQNAPEVLWPALGAFGVAALTLAYLRWARRIVAEADAAEARRAQFADQPWKWRQEWLGGAIAEKNAGGLAGRWVVALLWNAVSAPGVWAFFHESHRQPAMYLVWIFPLVGVGFVWSAIYHTVRGRKYGRARFVPASLPGVIGGYLGGVIEVPARITAEGDAALALRCVRRETQGSGKQRRTVETVLWEREERIPREKWSSDAGGTRLPVLFYIPAGQAASDDSQPDNTVEWRLAAAVATPGVDFATQFEVPVFATGETAAPPEDSAPLLDDYRAPELDAAALAACGVRREGDTFFFSARHLPVMRFTTAVLQLGWFALLAWYWGRDIHGMVWAITIFTGLILSLFTAGVWFDKYELRVEGREVAVATPRPWGTKVVRVPRDQVRLVRHAKAMASGEKQYFSLSLVGAEGIDPGVKAQEGEPFRVRKLRYQLAQLEKQGALSPEKVKELGGEIIAEFRRHPTFIVQFAAHIPGQTRAEEIGALVLAAIQKQ